MASGAPNISTFLASECPVDPSHLRSSTPAGTALVKLTLTDPRAVCNDGSPAIAYVRAATDAARSRRWVIHLMPGGGCNSHSDCRDRWCGEQGIYDAAKMSSRWTMPSIGEPGLLRRVAGNPPGQWNQVYVYYCSSDGWLGQAEFDLTGDTGEVYSLHARGHQIIEALLAALDAGARSDDGTVALPKLSEAERILWTGASAGSQGATQHLDWVAERYPAAQVEGLFDGGGPSADRFSPEIQAGADAYSQAIRVNFSIPAHDFYDASCVAASPAEEPWRCADTANLKLNHVTTPFFQRLDLRDPTGSKGLISLGATLPQWSTAARDGLIATSKIQETAAEKEKVTRAPGVYGPSCAQHIGTISDDWYNGATVKDDGGTDLTYRAALLAWLDGQDVVVVDTVPPSRSTCRATNDDQ